MSHPVRAFLLEENKDLGKRKEERERREKRKGKKEAMRMIWRHG